MHDYAPYLPLIGALLGLLTLAAAFRAGRRWRLIDNLPTSKTTGVFIGLVELKGTAESAAPLTSYLAGQPCVKANTNFAALQKSLVDTEQRIALARGYFNDIATQYKACLQNT